MMPMTRTALDFVADFGEAAVLLPAAAAAAVPLAFGRRWSAVLAWGGTLAACALVVVLLKLGMAELGAGGGMLPANAVRPRPIVVSGHACIATAFYGGLAVLARRVAGGLTRAAALALASVPAAAVCAAVWMLGWHGLPEIACGVLLGAVCPAALAALPMAPARPPGGAAAMLAAAALVVGVLHGVRVDYRAAADSGLLAMIGVF
jgi:hypothetical protein